MGYQVVYNALNKIPKVRFEDRAGERGAANCWNFLTTSLAASGMQDSKVFGQTADTCSSSQLAMGTDEWAEHK